MAINWTELESEYVTGQHSYAQLAADKGVSLSAVKEHGTKGGWNRKRKEYRRDCTARTAEKTAETTADKLAELQLLQLDAALELATRLNQQIKEAGHIKPAELLQYARALAALSAALPDNTSGLEQETGYGVVILPAREMIDPPPDE